MELTLNNCRIPEWKNRNMEMEEEEKNSNKIEKTELDM